jgi:DNA polymerase-1
MTDLVLIDGSSYLYRAFHALPSLTNSQGEPTGALHGVLTMILKLLRDEQPARVAVVFDAPGKTFRDQLFAEYKANRPPMPDDLRSQVQPILDAVEAMGLPLLQISGVEADDVIGTLCVEGEKAGLNVLVSTGDKDLAQLVTDKVTLINTMNDSRLDRDSVKAKFDVFPEQIIDYLGLVGDSSDNIPGVPKVGAKTAAKWLNLYGSADGIVEHVEEIKGKVGESLRDNVEQLRLSQELAAIKKDVELDIGIDDLKATNADSDALRKLYSHYELRSLLRQLDEAGDEPVEAPPEEEPVEYETVLTWKAFDTWLRKLNGAELVAFDTETNSLDYMNAEIVGFSLCTQPGDACYVPVAHDFPGAPDQLPRDEVLEKLKPWLEDEKRKKVGHHLKYDAHILARYEITLAGMAFDSMLESYVLNSVATRHDMDSVARQYLGKETIHYEGRSRDGSTLRGRGRRYNIAAPRGALESAGRCTAAQKGL